MPYYLLNRDEDKFPHPTQVLPERWVQRSSSGGWEHRANDIKPGKIGVVTIPVPPIVSEGNDASPDTVKGETDEDMDTDHIPAGDRKALFSFGKGGRNCPGMRIAKKEACIFFTELIRHFKFELEPGYVVQPKVKGVGQKPFDGIPFIVSRR